MQSFGKFNIHPDKHGIDLLSVSGHKIHGPKGVGFLYIKQRTKIKPQIYGGQQQNGIRSGTENVTGVAGMGVAVQEIYKNIEQSVKIITQLK